MAVRLERRHSSSLLNQSRVHTGSDTMSSTEHRLISLKRGIKDGWTKSRIFYDSMIDERKEEEKNYEKFQREASIKESMKTDPLTELTTELEKLRKLFPAAAASQDVRSRNMSRISSDLDQRSNRTIGKSKLKFTVVARTTTRESIAADLTGTNKTMLYSPIQTSAKKNLLGGNQNLLGTLSLQLPVVDTLTLKTQQQDSTLISSLSRRPHRQSQPLSRRTRTTSVYYQLPTPKVVKRLTSPVNYTGLMRRNALGRSSSGGGDDKHPNQRSSCTISHEDLRAERTARGAFSKGLRSDFYSLAER